MEAFIEGKAKAREIKSYKVTVDFMFTEAQLNDATPMTFTAKQLFDMLVERDDLATRTIKENLILPEDQILQKIKSNLQRNGEQIPPDQELVEKIKNLKA